VLTGDDPFDETTMLDDDEPSHDAQVSLAKDREPARV
jgi:hypothetical protein